MMFFVWVARIALYPILFILRLLGRTLLLLAMVLAVLWPIPILAVLFLWLMDLDVALLFGKYHNRFIQTAAFLVNAGLFGWLLKAIGTSALDAFRSLVEQMRQDLRGRWIPGWEVAESLAVTWHGGFAKIPRSIWRTGVDAFQVAFLLGVGAIQVVVTAPLFEHGPQMADRYIFVAGTEGAGPSKTMAGNGEAGEGAPGETDDGAENGAAGQPENGTTDGADDGPSSGLEENMKAHIRAGTVFSVTHLQDGQPKSGVGICLDDPQREWLGAFRDAIADCARLERAHGTFPGSMPTFEVTAFASAAPAKLRDAVDPKVNCEIANRRAHAVGAFLAGEKIADKRWWTCKDVARDFGTARSLCDGDEHIDYPKGDSDIGFRIRVNQWTDPARMEGGKPADDGSLAEERRYRVEMFNRSVHITVPQGFCRVPDSQESGRTRR